jgi:hypothetical protein
VFGTSIRGAISTTLPLIRRGGSIVLIGSINGTKGFLTETTCSATTVVRRRFQISAAELRGPWHPRQ